MLDVAIIGGGVCGLALAHSLQSRRLDWQLFEARGRLGGRVLTARAADGTPLDLGPTWYWPGHQPSITRLVADLGLSSLAQVDDGRVLHLHDPNRSPESVPVGITADGSLSTGDGVPPAAQGVHGGARRLAGGMDTLVQALARPLPPSRIALHTELLTVVDHGDFVELRLRRSSPGQPVQALSVQARRVVLALPPRLVESQVGFEPALAEDCLQAMRETPTWMATAAKAAFAYPRPFWRDAGLTGNAWVTHPQAVLAEVFDASPVPPDSTDGAAGPGALAGFLALGAQARQDFAGGMELLLRSQVGQLFGVAAEDGELHRLDWALEPWSCSPLDRVEDGRGGHPAAGDTPLAQPHWQGRLYFGGSETARQGAGYLEGALSAAARLRRELLSPLATPQRGGLPRASAGRPATAAANDEHLQSFDAWVTQERAQALGRYRLRLNQALSRQDDAQLTQKAVLGALESIYDEALQRLAALPLAPEPTPPQQGRAALTPRVLAPFAGLADELLSEAVKFNNTSCALSNFPYEHRPPRDYLSTIRRDLAAAWQAFALAANERLLHLPGASA